MLSPSRTQRNRGFTLIELIMVIVLLGILSVIAIPKFADLGSDTKAAVVDGLKGAIKSAVAIAAATCYVAPDCNRNSAWNSGTGTTAIINGTTYKFHYGNIIAWQIGGSGIAEFVDLEGFTAETYINGSYRRIFTLDSATTPANCSVTYQLVSNSSNYTITTDTSGC